MANESYGSIIHNGVNYSLGDGANSAKKPDLTDIILTGTTNTSGGTITAGTWFYLNNKLVKAKVDIASNATFTKDTNYEEKTIGEELSELNSKSTQVTTLAYVDYQNKTFQQAIATLSEGITYVTQASSYTPTDLPSGVTANQWIFRGLVMKKDNNTYFGILNYTGVSPARTWIITDGSWIDIK